MPYKHETKKKHIPASKDRRRKLTDSQKFEISRSTLSQRALAAMYGVSRRTIQFVRDPLKVKENLKRRAERGGWRQYYDTEERAATMRDYRRYKKVLDDRGELLQVVDPLERSPDAAGVLEPDELNLIWTEEEWDPTWFKFDTGVFYEGSISEHDASALESIRVLADRFVGLDKFIRIYPILAFDNGRIIDGRHRVFSALYSGLDKVTALIGHRELNDG